MKLWSATTLTLAGALVVAIGLQHVVTRATLREGFLELETRAAEQDMARAQAALARELEHLSAFAYDWTAWDDAHAFVQDGNQAFIDENLSDETFQNYDLTLLAFYKTDGSMIWGRAFDPASFGRPEGPVPMSFPTLLRDRPPGRFLSSGVPEDIHVGLVELDGELMLIAARPVLHSDYTGPGAGTLVVGRLLRGQLAQQLADQVGLELRIAPGVGGAAPEGVEIERPSNATLVARTRALGMDGEPLALLEASIPRTIWAQEIRTERTVAVLLALATLVFYALTLLLLRVLVLSPIAELTRAVLRVAETGDLATPVTARRSDEIGMLSREFQRMMQRLSSAQDRLVAQSYRTGMADMAVGALHNLGNSLQPVRVEAHLLGERLASVNSERVRQAIEQHDAVDTDPARRELLSRYLHQAADRALTVMEEGRAATARIVDQLAHAERILRAQEHLRDVRPAMQSLDPAQIVTEALDLLPADTREGVEIDVVDRAGCRVEAERVRLVQVFQNLLGNALDALHRVSGPRRIDVALLPTREGARDGVVVEIRDTGDGFDPARVHELFEAGVSTKEGPGHGFGLHWSALAVQTMNGRLEATSEGPGRGATFRVYLYDGAREVADA